MLFPARGVDIVWALYNAHTDLANGTEDNRRQLTRMIAEQMCFELGKVWGTKKGGPGNPQSKDAIAYDNGNGTFDVWDWQNGATRQPQVTANQPPDYPRLTSPQEFIEVTPVNHIGEEPPAPPDDEDDNDEELEMRVANLEQDVSNLQKGVSDLNRDITDLTIKIATLETSVQTLRNEVDSIVDRLLAVNGTGRNWGHAHPLNI